MKNRWLLSTICGAGLLAASAPAALAQNVPSGSGAATQTTTVKPAQASGTNTVLPADTAANPNASTGDAHFVYRASAGGMAEVMMGQLAVQRGQTQAVRDAGQMMVRDHTRADDRLMGIAQTVMLKPASGPDAMQQAMYRKLERAPAYAFDGLWTKGMIQSHEQTIALFKMEGHDGQNPQLRQFAMTTLPVLYKHLHVVEGLSTTRVSVLSGLNPMPTIRATLSAVGAMIHGNPDHSADQLNAQELNKVNAS